MVNKDNKIVELAIQQNLLLWELTHSMLDIEKLISKTRNIEKQQNTPDKSNNS